MESLLDGLDRQIARTVRPRRYGLLARRADRREARRDARAGLPYLDEEEPTYVGTPWCDVLASQGQAVFDAEWMLLQEDLHRLARARNDARRRLTEAAAAVAAAKRHLNGSAAPDPRRPAKVRGGEEHTTPLMRADRREREYDTHVAATLAELGRAQKGLNEAASEEATLIDALLRRIRIAQARVRQHSRFTQMRISAYWRWLVRRHPDGGRINAMVVNAEPFGPPAWAEMTPDDITAFLKGLDTEDPAGIEDPAAPGDTRTAHDARGGVDDIAAAEPVGR